MKRYRPPTSLMNGVGQMIESPNGDWVRFEDVKDLRRDLKNARAIAAVLVHAYDNDNRPPNSVVTEARTFIFNAKE